jgi:Zn-dependent protease
VSALVIGFVFWYRIFELKYPVPPETFSQEFIASILGILVSTLIVGVSFVTHEMAHKLCAQYFGFKSEFRWWLVGLSIALILCLFGNEPEKIRYIGVFFALVFFFVSNSLWFIVLGVLLMITSVDFIFIAPGAAYLWSPEIFIKIKTKSFRRKIGIIALAGPLVNLLLSSIALILFFISSFIPYGVRVILQSYIKAFYYINTLLCIFNCLPFLILDGQKIMNWNFWVWIVLFFSALAFFIITGDLILS